MYTDACNIPSVLSLDNIVLCINNPRRNEKLFQFVKLSPNSLDTFFSSLETERTAIFMTIIIEE